MEEELGLYDNNFSLYDSLFEQTPERQYKASKTGSTEVGRNNSFGDSMFDEDFFPNVSLNWDDEKGGNLDQLIIENRAQRQPWIAKAGAGVARVGTKVVSEIAKIPGVVGGIVGGGIGQIGDLVTGEDNTDFIQVAFNNPWIKAIETLEDESKKELLPVYVKKAVTEGNLWDNITAIDFWATEGADGLGYIISMLAPGAIINKAKIGAKLLSPFSKFEKMGRAQEKAAQVLSKVGITPTNIDLHMGTVANTFLEAGAEARSAMDSFEMSDEYKELMAKVPTRTDEIYQELLTDYKKNSVQPSEQFDAEGNSLGMRIPNEGEILEELKVKAAEQANKEVKDVVGRVGRNVFVANTAILIGPNAIMSKMLWGKPLAKTKVGKGESGVFEKMAQLTTKQNIKLGAKEFAIAGGREGFWEEGLQSTAETYFTENMPSEGIMGGLKDMGNFVGDLSESYADMVSSTEGQKAIFLGAVFGGGMSAYQGVVNEKKGIETVNQMVPLANKVLEDFDKFFKSDNEVNSEGNTKVKNKKESKDPAKIIEKLEGMSQIEAISTLYDQAIADKDAETVDAIRDWLTTTLVKPFLFNEQLGLDALRDHLEQSNGLIDTSEREGFEKKKFIDEVVNKAKYMKKQYDAFQNFGETFIDLQNKNATKEDKTEFYRDLANKYVNNRVTERNLQKDLDKTNELLDQVLESYSEKLAQKGVENDSNKVDDILKSDSRHAALVEKKKGLEKSIKESRKISEDIWNNNKLQKSFESYVNKNNEIREEAENTIKEEEVLAKIKGAKTLKELEAIELPENSKGITQINKAYEKKKAKITKAITKANSSKKKKGKQAEQKKVNEAAEKEKIVEKLKEQYNVGDVISLPKGLLSENVEDEEGYEIVKFTKTSVTLKNSKGKEFSISGESMQDNSALFTDNTSTEGGETESQEEVQTLTTPNTDEGGDARIVITNNQDNNKKGEKNEKLPFVDEAALEFERNGADKKGSYKVSINPGTATETDSQAEKADIEKRRQEKLKSYNYTLAEVNKMPNGLLRSFLLQANQAINNIKTNGGQKLLDYLNTNRSSVYDKTAEDNRFKKKQNTIIAADAIDAGLAPNWKVNDLRQAIKLYNSLLSNKEEINAKYDAELASLEEQQTSSFTNDNWNKALQMVQDGDYSNIEFLAKHLPLNIILTEGIEAPLETEPKNPEIFNKTSLKLRRAIIKELAAGTAIEDITVDIVGQYNGDLQLDGNNENIISQLQEFRGDVKNIKLTDIYIVDQNGALVNNKGELYPSGVSRTLAPGEIYINIKTAAGRPFPLKLNVTRINENESELIYQLIKYRFENRFDESGIVKEDDSSNLTPLSELPNILQLLNDTMPEVVQLFEDSKRNLNDVTVKELLSFFAYGSKNVKSRLTFDVENAIFYAGNEEFTLEEFLNNKQGFKDHLQSYKRRHIKKKRGKFDNNNLNLTRRAYMEYLITTGTLNTNAVVNEPAFQGKTTMYIDVSSVKVKEKQSKFSEKSLKKSKKEVKKVTKPKTPVKVVKEVKGKVAKKVSSTKPEPKGFNKTEAFAQFASDPESREVSYKGKIYFITSPLANEEGEINDGMHIKIGTAGANFVTDIKTALGVIFKYIAENGENEGLTRKNATKVWNSRNKSVSLQSKTKTVTTKTKETTKKPSSKKEETDSFKDELSKLKDDKVIKQYRTAMLQELTAIELDELNGVIGNYGEMKAEQGEVPSMKDYLLVTYDFLIQNGVKESTIKKRCS